MPERVQKVLAQLGMGSRRQIEGWIRDGKITINGKIAHLGDKVILKDAIRIENKPVVLTQSAKQKRQVLLYNKIEGEICSRVKGTSKRTVYENLPSLTLGRWISVGRLDVNTSGLLLFTTDGELANRLMHPSYQITREYAVRVFGCVDNAILHRLKQGVSLGDEVAKFNQIKYAGGTGSNRWYQVTLTEGRYREVRRLWQTQGLSVSRLVRIRFGTVQLPPSLALGCHKVLTNQQISKLTALVKLTI